jgi:hypothetical protein
MISDTQFFRPTMPACQGINALVYISPGLAQRQRKEKNLPLMGAEKTKQAAMRQLFHP